MYEQQTIDLLYLFRQLGIESAHCEEMIDNIRDYLDYSDGCPCCQDYNEDDDSYDSNFYED